MRGVGGEELWALDAKAFHNINYEVDTILIADHENGLYKAKTENYKQRIVDMRKQYFISDVEYLGHPSEHLNGMLWFDSGNRVEENYHNEANH
jgi:hypothetical protein